MVGKIRALKHRRKSNRNRCSLFPVVREEVLSLQDARQRAGWNITAFNLPEAWKLAQGEGVTVAVLDTGCDLDHPDLADNLLPGKNLIDPSKPPEDDNQHGCVHPSSIIQTNFCGIETIETLYDRIPIDEKIQKFADGYQSKIKDVSSLGIKTISYDLESNKTIADDITHVHKMPIDTLLVNIELERETIIKLTPWHPVIVSRMTKGRRSKIFKKRADQLDIQDRLILPNNFTDLSCEYYKINYPLWRCQQCGHVPNCKDKPKSECKKCCAQKWTKSSEFVNEKLAYICGLVATDGHISYGKNYRVEITNTNSDIINNAQKTLLDLGFKSKIDNTHGKCTRLLINSKRLVLFLMSAGIKSHAKTYEQGVPEFVGKSPTSVICAFLGGVIDGDGCISKTNTQNRITTVSVKFATQLCALLNGMGISSGLAKYKNVFKGCENNDLPILNVVFNKVGKEIAEWIFHPKKRNRVIENQSGSKRTVRRIKSLSREPYKGMFYDFTTRKTGNYIANGHFVSNTHVTGIICAQNNDIGMVGVAPGAKVIPIKVLDKNGDGHLTTVAQGVYLAIERKADIIAMSLGAPVPVNIVRDAIQAAADKGIPTFVAAGNAGNTKEVFFPAAYPETIAVGSIDENFKRSKFSNTGRNLDFMAPGGRIFSTVPDNWYAILSGTSMACPFAVGAAALMLSYKRKKNIPLKLKTVEDYRNIFRKHATPISDKDLATKKFYQGFGIIDPKKMLEEVPVTYHGASPVASLVH